MNKISRLAAIEKSVAPPADGGCPDCENWNKRRVVLQKIDTQEPYEGDPHKRLDTVRRVYCETCGRFLFSIGVVRFDSHSDHAGGDE